MALTAESLWANLEQSLDDYIEAQLVQGQGFLVNFPSAPGIQNPPARWIEVDYVTIGPLWQEMRTADGGIGSYAQLDVQLAHFEQIDKRWDGSGEADAYSLARMIDVSRDVLSVKADIPIRDYTQGGNPQVASFRAWGPPTEVAVATPPDLRIVQRTLVKPLYYMEEV